MSGSVHGQVRAVFDVRGAEEAQVAAAVAELVDTIHKAAIMPGCECDLDVSFDVEDPAGDGG